MDRPTISFPIPHPRSYLHPSVQVPEYHQPTHFTSFSYGPNREAYLPGLDGTENSSVQCYVEPNLGADLRDGFNECVWRDEAVDEGLDTLLDCLLATTASSPEQLITLMKKTSLITWRGMMTRILSAVYEGVVTDRAEGWEMRGQLVDGVLYLEEHITHEQLQTRSEMPVDRKLQTHFGYSFESYCTRPPVFPPSQQAFPPPVPPCFSPPPQIQAAPTPWRFEPPNTNEQWCSVIKSGLGAFGMILGGEVDCLLDVRDGDAAGIQHVGSTDHFLELKTSMMLTNDRDVVRFEKTKLLKFWAQSYILGVPNVVVGFRDRQGVLQSMQWMKTLDIPRMVRGKPHSWDPAPCLSSGHAILAFIRDSLSSHPATQAFESRFHDLPPMPNTDLAGWPAFKITFKPALGGEGQVEIVQMSGNELASIESTRAKRESRAGILPMRWIRALWNSARMSEDEARHGPSEGMAVSEAPVRRSSVLIKR